MLERAVRLEAEKSEIRHTYNCGEGEMVQDLFLNRDTFMVTLLL